MDKIPSEYNRVNELSNRIDKLLKEKVKKKEINPSIFIAKVSLMNTFNITKDLAPRIWESLRNKGYQIEYRKIAMPKDTESVVS